MPSDYPILFFDGVCRFCNASVQMVLKKDRKGVVHFAALQSRMGQEFVAAHPELKGIDSVILLEEDGRISVKSNAAFQVIRRVGGWWRLFLIFSILPRSIRDRMYDAFARKRYSLFGKNETCMVPDANQRSRFVDITPIQ